MTAPVDRSVVLRPVEVLLGEARRLADAAPFPVGELFVAGSEGDDEHPWWIFAFDKWDDEQESVTSPVGYVGCPSEWGDGRDRFDREEALANFVVDASKLLPELAARLAALTAAVERVEALCDHADTVTGPFVHVGAIRAALEGRAS